MKILSKYLVTTSVLFHLILLVAAVGFSSYVNDVKNNFGDALNSSKFEAEALVTDITELSRDGLVYTGYLINLNGKDLYVTGPAHQNIAIGDKVKVMTMINSFQDEKKLSVYVRKAG
jgi:hypothetical protein